MQTQTGSAIDAWEQRWATEAGRAGWIDAHPAVVALIPELKARGARCALDLGCGVGRHALLLAAEGFEVEAFDGSETGLAVLRETAASRGLRLGVEHGNADTLPYPDASFDFVLSWNVIYHGTMGDVGARIAEIWRVLKPGGLYQGTMLPTRHVDYPRGRFIAPGTLVCDGPDEERNHPHFYCDAATLVALFSGFDLLSLSQAEQHRPGSWHWHLVAERLGS
ncbi:MAG TPA: class I SAM-dependent methyltransferase [Stellaceae bacterium]|nr:class I SAM-dependent methyltransferase [Stellaceae bacterium]